MNYSCIVPDNLMRAKMTPNLQAWAPAASHKPKVFVARMYEMVLKAVEDCWLLPSNCKCEIDRMNSHPCNQSGLLVLKYSLQSQLTTAFTPRQIASYLIEEERTRWPPLEGESACQPFQDSCSPAVTVAGSFGIQRGACADNLVAG